MRMKRREIEICGRRIGDDHPPFVIAEIGINHEGSMTKAKRMIDDAASVGCEVVKFQAHVIVDEMIPNDVVPGNAKESIWDIMSRCALTEEQDAELKAYTERTGMIYLSTPFSRAAAERLKRLAVPAIKIGSGECNNFPLIRHISGFGVPVILSTGMNNLDSIRRAVAILDGAKVDYALLHCTSIYPTPYDKVRLGAITELRREFDVPIGLSDHSLSIAPCLGAVALGASILERHFTSDMEWPGPDIEVSMDPPELKRLIEGSRAIHAASSGTKTVLEEESPTIAFAYSSVVTIRPIKAGETFSSDNLWVKRPGTGEFLAESYDALLGKVASVDIGRDVQLKRAWVREQ
jgi:sialic acid synthase SpsE